MRLFTTLHLDTRRIMMTRSLDDIISYEKQALDLLPLDHPHYEEIKTLLIDQVNDEIQTYANTRTD